MKHLIFAFLIFSFSFSVFSACPDRVKTFIQFDNVSVPANNVCIDQELKILKTHIASSTQRVCVESSLDRSDSTHSREVCTRYETINYPERNLERSLFTKVTKCVEYNRDDSTHPKCIRFEETNMAVSLYYLVDQFRGDDYRCMDPSFRRKSIAACL